MLSILKYGFYASLLAGAAYIFVGPDKLMSYAQDGEQMIKEKISDARGMERELDSIKSQINGLDQEIKKLRREVIERKVDVDTLQGTIQKKDEDLSRLRGSLEKAGELLAKTELYYEIGGIKYSFAEVEKDAEIKFQEFQTKEQALANLRETLRIKTHALEVRRENVKRAQALRTELSGKVRLAEAKLERLRAREVYAESMDQGELARELKTELGKANKAMAEFERRLDVKNRTLTERINTGPGDVGGIDYDRKVDDVADIGQRIRQHFLIDTLEEKKDEVAGTDIQNPSEVADN